MNRSDTLARAEYVYSCTIGEAPDVTSEMAFSEGLRVLSGKIRSELIPADDPICHDVLENGHLAHGLARWYEQACPILYLKSHTHAALLGATSIPDSSVVLLKGPWRAVLVEFPANLIPLAGDDYVRSVLAHRVPRTNGCCWSLFTLSERVSAQIIEAPQDAIAAWDLTETPPGPPDEPEALVRVKATPESVRLLQVCARIVFGALLTLESSPIGEGQNRGCSAPQHGRRRGSLPTHRVYTLGQPVAIDCRESIVSYIKGGALSQRTQRGPLTLQFLVRGHWRNQAYGTNHSLRRPQWIQPFWKGPEDGAIVVRPRELQA